jgi:hypothetical protein
MAAQLSAEPLSTGASPQRQFPLLFIFGIAQERPERFGVFQHLIDILPYCRIMSSLGERAKSADKFENFLGSANGCKPRIKLV